MGNPKINMREFVQVYILLALDFVQRESNLPVESLEENIDAELHKLFDVCEKDMIYLRHPLHWTFFCNKKSPFELKRNIRAIRWAIPFSQASFLLPAPMGLSSLSTNKIFILQTNEARYRVAFAEFHYSYTLRRTRKTGDFV